MGLAGAMGVGRMRLLRSRSSTEAVAFWGLLILSYLAIYGLSETLGVGYSERLDPATASISFDLNPFLWFPDLILRNNPAANPVPFLLWWVLLAFIVAEVVMVGFRVLRPGPRTRFVRVVGNQKPPPK